MMPHAESSEQTVLCICTFLPCGKINVLLSLSYDLEPLPINRGAVRNHGFPYSLIYRAPLNPTLDSSPGPSPDAASKQNAALSLGFGRKHTMQWLF